MGAAHSRPIVSALGPVLSPISFSLSCSCSVARSCLRELRNSLKSWSPSSLVRSRCIVWGCIRMQPRSHSLGVPGAPGKNLGLGLGFRVWGLGFGV